MSDTPDNLVLDFLREQFLRVNTKIDSMAEDIGDRYIARALEQDLIWALVEGLAAGILGKECLYALA
jgi:hypothetical protein